MIELTAKPKVSVLIACRNAQRTVGHCLESILSQTVPAFEILVCDDGSTDKTVSLVEKFAQGDGRIKLLKNPSNQGAASARNRCLDCAQGEYIAIQDADDYSSPDRFEKQAAFLDKHPEFAFVSAGMARFDAQGEWSWHRSEKRAPQKEDLLAGPPFVHAASVFRREALALVGGYRVARETRRGQDYDLFLRLYAAGLRGANLPDILYFYLQDREGFARKKYRYRVDEVVIRFRGYRAMGMLARGAPYLVKPLLAGLIPRHALRRRMQKASNGPVRVLQVVSSLGCGGVALSLLTFAEHMDAERVRFDYFTHFGRQGNHKELTGRGIRVYYGETIGRIGVAGYCRQWLRLLRDNYYDAVVIHTNYQAGLVALCAKLAGIQVRICHIRGTYIAQPKVEKRLWVCRRLIDAAATHRWACSREAGKFYYGRKKFEVVPEPIDLSAYKVPGETAAELRRALSIPPRAEIWGHVGRFSPEKNHAFLLSLLRERLSRPSEVFLVLAGDGVLFEPCREAASRLGVLDNCRFLGNRKDIPALMGLFDILLLPSLSEGFPNVAVQAQAAGTPVLLSSRISGEVDFGVGLVHRAEHDCIRDWLEAIRKFKGGKAEREGVHAVLRERGYECGEAAQRMQAFFEQVRRQ